VASSQDSAVPWYAFWRRRKEALPAPTPEETAAWRRILADNIEYNLARYLEGAYAAAEFDVGLIDPRLEDGDRIPDKDVWLAWRMADGLADSVRHGIPDMDGTAWEEGIPYLRSVVECLRAGKEIPPFRRRR
jgi:hypothetical protein